MLRFCVLLALALSGTVLVHAQTINTTWWAIVNSTRINDRFSTHFDGQWRSGDNYSTMSSLILRPGLNYKVTSRFTATLGYAYIANRRSYQLTGTGVDPVSISGYVPEHRIFQQAVYVHPIFGKNTISHRARLEQRFLMTPSIENNKVSTDGNTYANRFRYFFRSVIPFKQEFPYNKGWFGAIQNEVMVNFGDKCKWQSI